MWPSGYTTLFLDSVDFFNDTERATANDLVREAAALPGFNVVVAARRAFGTDEPNRLPAGAIEQLRRAPTVIVDELTDTEIGELRSAAPELGRLLSDGHPAREVVRNLFRLDRLVGQPSSDPVPHTEAEMAELWWQTGDGKTDDQARHRTRLLRDVADKSLSGHAGPLDTSTYPSPPLNTLVKSGTLSDFGGERLVFVMMSSAIGRSQTVSMKTARQLALCPLTARHQRAFRVALNWPRGWPLREIPMPNHRMANPVKQRPPFAKPKVRTRRTKA